MLTETLSFFLFLYFDSIVLISDIIFESQTLNLPRSVSFHKKYFFVKSNSNKKTNETKNTSMIMTAFITGSNFLKNAHALINVGKEIAPVIIPILFWFFSYIFETV